MLFNKEDLHNIIAIFVVRDFRNEKINFTIDEQGFLFSTRNDIEKSIVRAKQMGYDKWLFNGEEPRIMEK